MHILGSLHGIYFQVYPKTTLLVPQMYTNTKSHKHKTTQLTWIRLVHNCNIWTFDTVTGWSLLHLLNYLWVHQKIYLQIFSYHILNSSASIVFQNNCNIMVSIIHIYCPTSKKLYFLHWLVEMLQRNPINIPLIYDWKNLIRNTLESLLILLDTRCIQ